MASINVQPIGDPSGEARCFLLEVEEATILLDVGCDDKFSPGLLDSIARLKNRVDVILLSHPDVQHLGALPYLMGKMGMRAQVYSTLPIKKMGHLTMYDAFASLKAAGLAEDLPFDIEDVDTAFDSPLFKTLQYTERHNLTGNGEGISITAYPSGRTLGGSLWRIAVDMEEIVYAVDYNHGAERHLNPTTLSKFVRPAVLITDANNAQYERAMSDTRPRREKDMCDAVRDALRKDGNVLIPCDSASRVLELIMVLENEWRSSRHMSSYKIALMGYTAISMLQQAQGLLEFMSEQIQTQNISTRANPFQLVKEGGAFKLSHIRVCHSVKQLEQLPGPVVVLASEVHLEYGYGRDIFLKWAHDSRNLVLFPSRQPAGTLANTVCSLPGGGSDGSRKVEVEIKHRQFLDGDELDEYLEDVRAKKNAAKAAEEAAFAAEAARLVAEAAAVDGVAADAGALAVTPVATGAASPLGVGGQQAMLMDLDNDTLSSMFFRTKSSKCAGTGRLMFSHKTVSVEADEYGECINEADFQLGYDIGGGEGGPSTLSQKEEYVDDATAAAEAAEAEKDQKAEALDERPCKYVTESRSLAVVCAVKSVDFEGRSDGKAIKTILTQITPRKIVLVHGSEAARAHLGEWAEKDLGCEHVMVPALNESVDATSDLDVYKVHLTDSFFSSLNFSTVDGYEIAWMDGTVQLPSVLSSDGPQAVEGGAGAADMEVATAPNLEQSEGEDDNEMEVMDATQETAVVDVRADAEVPGHTAVFIGDVKLVELKHALAQKGIKSDLYQGSLYTQSGHVKIQKLGDGRVVHEGCLCAEYFAVRKLLYDSFTIL